MSDMKPPRNTTVAGAPGRCEYAMRSPVISDRVSTDAIRESSFDDRPKAARAQGTRETTMTTDTATGKELIVRGPQADLSGVAILQVLDALDHSGPARSAVDLARAIRHAGGRPLIASAGGPLLADALVAGAEHLQMSSASSNPFTLMGTASQLSRYLAQEKVSVVHLRSRPGAWPARRAARRRGTATVATVSALSSAGGKLAQWLEKAVERADRVIAPSAYVQQALGEAGMSDRRIRHIPPGVDLARFNPAGIQAARIINLARDWQVPDGAAVVLCPAADADDPGTRRLVDAMALVRAKPVVAYLLGEADGALDGLQRLVDDRELNERVRLYGPCRDLPAAYMLSDVVAVPNMVPPVFGQEIAEAAAMGRPVVATDLGASREMVAPGETGWLVVPDNDAALAEAIDRAVLMDLGHRRAMALAARRLAQDSFSLAGMCARTLDIYREVMTDPT
ncbi:hypothetical protein CCR80_08335 [Rhodothalassium salexigens]|nr:hypothetical protein [Rhodothalassium salexigens]